MENDLFLFPLVFAIALSVLNFGNYKINQLLGIVLTIMFSYAAFFGGYFSLYITGNIFSFLSDLGSALAISISAFVIAPLLFFYGLGYLFSINNTSFVYSIKIISILLLSVYALLVLGDFIETSFIQSNLSLLNPYNLWQIVMALAVQLIIYEKHIFNFKN
jgi:hypothetical protein